MAVVHGTLDQPLEDTMAAVRRAAADEGYALAEGESGATHLVFRKGVTAVSWGSQFTVTFESSDAGQTVITIDTHETNAPLTDWGRGRRRSHKLLHAIGAHE